MQSYPKLDMDELMSTFEWVSAGALYENRAFVSRVDGKIYWDDDSSDEELPENIDDESIYAVVPHKTELGLGSRLAVRFARDHLSPDDHERVIDIFHRSGAFRRFKDLLDRRGKLQLWYDHDNQAHLDALREWCEDNGLLPPTERSDDDDE